MSDTRILAPNRPAITYSLRGALSLEQEVQGPNQDLHSGNFGGAIKNPLCLFRRSCPVNPGKMSSDRSKATLGYWDGDLTGQHQSRANRNQQHHLLSFEVVDIVEDRLSGGGGG